VDENAETERCEVEEAPGRAVPLRGVFCARCTWPGWAEPSGPGVSRAAVEKNKRDTHLHGLAPGCSRSVRGLNLPLVLVGFYNCSLVGSRRR
jgi:hypothetical protein